jgi:uncharacterized tellurite resistance protein B-like protein
MLESFAKRRAPLYARPDLAPPGRAYWPGIAAALAPIGPPSWMPMEAIVLSGNTLEGGARGLRGLFTREPSEKERKRVLRLATLAARIMQIIASADARMHENEAHLIEMAMNSFGLSPEERGKARIEGALSFETLEVGPDLEARTRRDLLRGAWQLALIETLDPATDVMVRGVAAALGLSADYDHVRTEVQTEQKKQTEVAQVAIELIRAAVQKLPIDGLAPWLDHLVEAAVPPARRNELRGLASGNAPVLLDGFPKLDGDRRRQTLALAAATLIGPDPSVARAIVLRAELLNAAEKGGVASGAEQAFTLLDRWMLDRSVTHAHALLEPPPVIAPAPGTPAAFDPQKAAQSSGQPLANVVVATGVQSPAAPPAPPRVEEPNDANDEQKPETD